MKYSAPATPRLRQVYRVPKRIFAPKQRKATQSSTGESTPCAQGQASRAMLLQKATLTS